jgi:threonine dehydrogenase-like Zn-dependent dehydrogenase
MKFSFFRKPAVRVALTFAAFTSVAVIAGLTGLVATSTSAHATQVPEPASMLMLGAGVIGLIAARGKMG